MGRLKPAEWNLLVTCDPGHAPAARANVTAALQHLGVRARFREGAPCPPGIIEARVDADPRDVVRQVEELARRDPRAVAHTHRWRPVDAWSEAEVNALRRSVSQVAEHLAPADVWRMAIRVHGPSEWRASQLMVPLTEPVRRGVVRMRDPDKVLRVDLMGGEAAMSLLGKGDELRVDRVIAETMHMPQDL